jgi:hypothetical protein
MSTSAPSLLTLIGDVKTFFLGGFLNMPMAITGTLLIVSLMTANYSMLFMAIGILLIVPIAWYVLHMLAELAGSTFNWPGGFGILKSDLSTFIPPYPVKATSDGFVYTGVGLWAAMMMFILGYLLSNAMDLYTYESKTPVLVSDSTRKMLEEGTSNRKSQAVVSIAIIAIIILTIVAYRLINGMDPIFSGLIGMILLLLAGGGWYRALASQTEGRLSDVFGIANRILKPMAMQDEPLACLPQGQSTSA